MEENSKEINNNNIIKEIQDADSKNLYLINKEKTIIDIFYYLQNKTLPFSEKLIIVKYLIKCLTNIPINAEIFFSKNINNQYLYQAIINQFIINYENKEYYDELKKLFSILLKYVSYNKLLYQYIISFISNYINKKSLLLNDINNININEKYFDEYININDFNSNHLLAILELIYVFYEKGKSIEEPYNYFYFTGHPNNNIKINNKNSILNLNTDIYILLFINLVDIKYLEKFDKLILLEIQLNDSSNININIIPNKNNPNAKENTLGIPFDDFLTNKINKVLIKINKNSKIDILINNVKQNISKIVISKEQTIKSLILFNEFIGTCTNIIIYKNNKNINEIYIPKFINNDLYKNGIYKEELFSAFIKAQISNDIDEKNITDKNILSYKDSDLPEIKDFIENNLISIYIPTRNEKSEKTNNIYLRDSISNLDAILNIDSTLNGIHSQEKTIKAFYSIGSINHLLPIMELVNKENHLANGKILDIFMDIINYIFSNLPNLFQLYDKKSRFFFYLSHFLEKIPENLYCEDLNKEIRVMSIVFLAFKDDKNYQLLGQQFLEYILLNENILFKFSFELQKNIINQIIIIINERSKSKLLINIDIIKIINILLYYDSQKYNKYCCKNHSEYFKDAQEKGILSPELYELIGPTINLLKELFNRFSGQLKNQTKSATSSNNNNPPINDYNLDKLFDLLTFDISPCLQKSILAMFYELKSKPKELNHLNKNGKFLYILLFLLKTTLFEDIKLIVYDFMMVLFNENKTNSRLSISNNSNNNNIMNIRQYIEYNILPFFLLIDDRGREIKVKNTSEEIDENGFSQYFFIYNIKYKYLVLSPQQEKLYINYNKIKLEELIKNLFDKIYNNFNSGIDLKMNLNILVIIASKGDVLLIIKFLDKIKQELDNKKDKKYSEKCSEIYSNNNFLHWLLEISFHSYLLKDSILNKKNDINNYNYGLKFPANIAEKDRDSYINKIFDKANDLIINIFNNNIYKLDHLISWIKYYYRIIEDNNNFKLISKFVYDFILQKIIFALKEINQPNISASKAQRKTLYFYNIIFEYFTYFKINTNLNNNEIEDEETLYQEISTPFKFSILNELKKELKNNSSQDIYDVIPKLPFYSYMNKILLLFKPIWFDDKKKIKNDKDFYKTYIYHKQNLFVNDLEFLFYSFRDITELQQNDENIYIFGNKGIPLIFILFHQFTIFLTIVTEKKAFKQVIENFRLLISLVVVSSCTLSISKEKSTNISYSSGESNKINWPNEEQYKRVQRKVHLFLFNSFYFFYYKIVEINTNIQKNKENKEKLDNLNNNKKYIYDTICYILRLLNTILKERKIHEEDKKKHNIKAMFSAIKKMIITKVEGIALSGPYLFILEFYTKCFVTNKPTNNENFDLNNFIINNKTFMDEIPIFNIDDMQNDTSPNYVKLYQKIEKCGNSFMNDPNIKKYFDENVYEYQKILFPFLKYVLKRKELVHNIIPIYDNSIYCRRKYNSICLLPNYYPEYPFYKNVIYNICKINEHLSDEIRFSQMKSYFDNYDRITKYYKIKKRLFSFNGLWSKREFFYDKNKYNLKYKIFNHLTEDYTKIFLTPIIDIDYYLPKFSSFNTKELFRANNGEIISLRKITDLSSDSIDKSKDEKDNEEELTFVDKNEKEEINEEKTDNENLYLIKDKKEDQLNSLYLIKKINYKFVENLNEEEQNNKKHYKLFIKYVNKMNNIN